MKCPFCVTSLSLLRRSLHSHSLLSLLASQFSCTNRVLHPFSLLRAPSMPSSFAFCVIFSVLISTCKGEDRVVQQQQLWCVAMNNADDSALQQALDWACGPGAADCGPIQQGGPCYDPTDLIGMASYAFNDYCLKHGMTDETCNFSKTAALTSLDPSYGKCKFASSTFSAGNSTTPSTAGILPGSENMSASRRLTATEVWMLVLPKLLLAFFAVFQ